MFAGEILRMLRLIKNVPQKTLAKCLDISQQAVSKIEHSKNVSGKIFIAYLKAMSYCREELENFKFILPSSIWLIIESTFL